MAVKLVIEPIFEADFIDTSYGFRPRKSAHDAIEDITYALNCGYRTVIDADVWGDMIIRSCGLTKHFYAIQKCTGISRGAKRDVIAGIA